MKIRTKLIGGLMLIAILSGGIGLVSFLANRSIEADLRQITLSSLDEVKSATEMALAIEASQTAAEELIAENYRGIVEPDEQAEASRAAQVAEQELRKSLEEFEEWQALNRAATERGVAQATAAGEPEEAEEEEEELKQIDDLQAEFDVYKTQVNQYISSIHLNLQDADEFLQDMVESQYRNKVLPLVKSIEEDAIEELTAENEEVQEAAARSNIIVAVLTATIVLTVVGLGLLFASAISRGIVQTKNAAVEIAKGNLDVKISVRGKDEITELTQALDTMRQNLKKALETTKQENVTLSTALKERQKAEKLLKDKVIELEKFQKLTIGRELKMIDLKKQIEEQKQPSNRKKSDKKDQPPPTHS